MLADLSWNTLQERRLQSKTVMFDQLVVIPTTPHLIPARTPRGHNIQVLLPQSTVNAHIYSLFPCTMRIWNQLPPEVISSTSLEMFKQRLPIITSMLEIPCFKWYIRFFYLHLNLLGRHMYTHYSLKILGSPIDEPIGRR